MSVSLVSELLIDEVTTVVRHQFRKHSASSIYYHYRTLMDTCIAPLVDSYLSWVDYPSGDQSINVGLDLFTMKLSQRGRYLYTSVGGNRSYCPIICWDLSRGLITAELYAHKRTAICLDQRASLLASGSQDNRVCVWRIKPEHELLYMLIGHVDCVMSVSLSEDGSRLMSGSLDATVRVWCVNSGVCLMKIKCLDEVLSVLLIGDYMLSASLLTVHVWDQKTGIELHSYRNISYGLFRDLAAFSDPRRLACVWSRRLTMIDRDSMKEKLSVSMDTGEMTRFNLSISSKEGSSVIFARISDDMGAEMFQIQGRTAERVWVSQLIDKPRIVEFTADGSRLVVLTQSGEFIVFDLSLVNLL